jgi:hypothetical protein
LQDDEARKRERIVHERSTFLPSFFANRHFVEIAQAK